MKYVYGALAVIIAAAAWAYFAGGTRAPEVTREASSVTELSGLGVGIDTGGLEIVQRARAVQAVGTVVEVSTPELKGESEECHLGVFYRIEKKDVAGQRTRWTEASLKAAATVRDGVPASVREFSEFYLVFEPSQAACAPDAASGDRESVARMRLWRSVGTARLTG